MKEKISQIIKNCVYAIICDKCNGGGSDSVNGNGDKKCPECNGTGLTKWETDFAAQKVIDYLESLPTNTTNHSK